MAFIKVDRRTFDHWIWMERPFSKGQAWLDLVHLANHSDGKFLSHGNVIDGKRGNVYRSQTWLAERWGWSRKKVNGYLKMLEREQMVTVKGMRMGTVNGTVITLVNYEDFQGVGTVKGTVKAPSRNGEGTVKAPSRNTYNNDKEIPNNEEKGKDILPPAEPDEELDNEEWIDPTMMTKEEFIARMKGEIK